MTTDASQGGAALTAEERAELREVCRPLMPEGWQVSDRTHLFSSVWGVMEMRAVTDETDGVIAWLPDGMGNEAEFIAAARTALPRLLDALERKDDALREIIRLLKEDEHPAYEAPDTLEPDDDLYEAFLAGKLYGCSACRAAYTARATLEGRTALTPEQGRPTGEAAHGGRHGDD